MTGSDEEVCPNCGEQARVNFNTRSSIDMSMHCDNCGLNIQSKLSFDTLEELNDSREMYELSPLTELPKQDMECF